MRPRTPADPPGQPRPPGGVRQLLYNRPSDTLVAVMGLRPSPPLQRLFYRRLPWEEYCPVGVRHELESQEDAHCCERVPYLVFNEKRFREPDRQRVPAYLEPLLKDRGLTPPPEMWGADWLGIRRINLETGEDTRVLDEESLRPPLPYTSGWVSQIISVSADGSGAVCQVGLTPGGGVDYWVMELSFFGGPRRMVARLPYVFL
jgi:hypothetical protein